MGFVYFFIFLILSNYFYFFYSKLYFHFYKMQLQFNKKRSSSLLFLKSGYIQNKVLKVTFHKEVKDCFSQDIIVAALRVPNHSGLIKFFYLTQKYRLIWQLCLQVEQGYFYLFASSFLRCCFTDMVQCGSSHRHIITCGKGRRGTWEIITMYYKYMNQTLHAFLLFLLTLTSNWHIVGLISDKAE